MTNMCGEFTSSHPREGEEGWGDFALEDTRLSCDYTNWYGAPVFCKLAL